MLSLFPKTKDRDRSPLQKENIRQSSQKRKENEDYKNEFIK